MIILIIVIKGLNMLVSDYVSVSIVDSKGKPRTLADYVRAVRNEKRLSLSDVERLSSGHISDSYVWRIENGHITNVTPKMLRALARGLQVPEDEVFTVARGKSTQEPSAVENQLLTFFRQLPDERKEDVMRFIRSLHQAHAVKEDPVSEKKKHKIRRVS
jgi:transcriptional regulator with XRE-family HTH domain